MAIFVIIIIWTLPDLIASHSKLTLHTLQGVFELGDGDTPSASIYFGRRAEIFEYRLIGQHRTQSGKCCSVFY